MPREIAMTNMGWVATKRTEWATVVYRREVIQVAKCRARAIPARTE